MTSHFGETSVSFDIGVEDGRSNQTLERQTQNANLALLPFRNHSRLSDRSHLCLTSHQSLIPCSCLCLVQGIFYAPVILSQLAECIMLFSITLSLLMSFLYLKSPPQTCFNLVNFSSSLEMWLRHQLLQNTLLTFYAEI